MTRLLAPEKVLVVDDNAQNRALAEGYLGAAGYDLLTASDGKEAIARFGEWSPDLVLLDILMPGLDGFETCKRLRLVPGGAETPIVFLTALADLGTHKTALESGADDFLTKPINQTELLLRVRSLLRIKRLSRELTRNYELIRSQRDALVLAEQQKKDLTTLVVHDLKSPLTVIAGNVDFVLHGEGIPDTERDALRDAFLATETMLRMVMNLLDISRSEDGALVPQLSDVDVTGLIEEVKGQMARQAADNRQEVVLSAAPGIHVRADRDLLRRVLENLLDNCFKYTPARGTITVEAEAVETGLLAKGGGGPAPGRWCEVRVRDQGRGIPPTLRDKIFDKYARLSGDDDPKARTSRGLGLAFCRRAVEAHGGRIWLEDNQPVGTVFCVRLPDAPAEDEGVPSPERPASAGG